MKSKYIIETEKEELIDKGQASITGTIIAGTIVSFIVFGLMMHFIIVPMQEKQDEKINAISVNNSRINIIDENINKINENQIAYLKKLKTIQENLGIWKCTKYKKYFDQDCIIISGLKDSVLINDNTCISVDFQNTTTYFINNIRGYIPKINYTQLPLICEDWEYVKEVNNVTQTN